MSETPNNNSQNKPQPKQQPRPQPNPSGTTPLKVAANAPSGKSAPVAPPPDIPTNLPPLFRKFDWLTAGVGFLLVWTIYFLTMAPELTLEDSGELVTGSVYAGIPHPPGYPVWAIYTYFWTKFIPWGNMAWRVTLGELTAAAFGCGLVALMVSRGSSMLMEGIDDLKAMTGKWEKAICTVCGVTAALLVGLDGFVWSESVVINRISLFGMPWLMILLVCIMRWMYAPSQMRFLYVAMFCFGICITIHQTLMCAAMGIELAILFAKPKLGRDLLLVNSICYVLGLMFRDKFSALGNDSTMLIFHAVGLLSIAGCVWQTAKTAQLLTEWWRVIIMAVLFTAGVSFYFWEPISGMTNPPMQWGYPRTVDGFFHALSRGQYDPTHPTDVIKDPLRFLSQMWLMVKGITDEYSYVYALLALLPFLFIRKLKQRERAWLAGLCGIYFCIGVILMIMLNPNPDRASVELNKVFFASSHAVVGIMVGYGMALTAAFMATNYQRFRRWGLIGGALAILLAIICLKEDTGVLFRGIDGSVSLGELPGFVAQAFAPKQYGLPVYANLILIATGIAFVIALLIYKKRGPLFIILGLYALMPVRSGMAHWFTSEQRNHMFGYWFGHDMFTPPFKDTAGKPLYPEMAKDAILYGGTDPGRFCPTYMVFCESFTPHDCQPVEDQKFDRRDVYVITQNALADGTYLNYIRAHYNRSKQIDPPFFSEFFHTSLLRPLDTLFTHIGDNVEKDRRTYTSWLKPAEFTDLPALVAKLKPGPGRDKLSEFLYENLDKSTQALLNGQGNESSLRSALSKDLNRILEQELKNTNERQELTTEKTQLEFKLASGSSSSRLTAINTRLAELEKQQPLFDPARFSHVKISHYLTKFVEENPKSHTRIRLNRLLLEEAYPGLIAKSLGGIYPDREIAIATPEEGQMCFNAYLADAKERSRNGRLKAGEDVKVDGDKVQISGQVAVIAINANVAELMFNKNPENEFYVEESFPLDWMYPYLTPFGIIMKVNRQPLPTVPEEVLKKDHDFWKQYLTRMTGDIINYDTKISDVTNWVEKVYLRHDLSDFKGDPKFLRDKDAPKAFSKLRSSIAGVYAWRLQDDTPSQYRPKSEEDAQRIYKEADFAFLQAFALCPYSPEAVYRYITLLCKYRRFSDALMIAQTCYKLDPNNGGILNTVTNLQNYVSMTSGKMTEQVEKYEADYNQNTNNFQTAVNLANIYTMAMDGSNALRIIDSIAANPKADGGVFELLSTQVLPKIMSGFPHYEARLKANPDDTRAAALLLGGYVELQQTERALAMIQTIISNPKSDAVALACCCQACIKINNADRLEAALQRVTQLDPNAPEPWLDLAATRAVLNRNTEALDALAKAVVTSDNRLKTTPTAPNLTANIRMDSRFAALRSRPEYKAIFPDATNQAKQP